MPKLVPNSPAKRLSYVFNSYLGTKNERIIPGLFTASLHLLGRDQWAADWMRQWGYGLNLAYWEGQVGGLLRNLRFEGEIDENESDRLKEDLKTGNLSPLRAHIDRIYDMEMDGVALPVIEGGLPTRHKLDFVIPWIAKELGRLSKAERRGNATPVDYYKAVQVLEEKGTAIGTWADEERMDLSQITLHEALDAIRDYDFGENRVEQGVVVHRWPDGWTVQALKSEIQLYQEGRAMQNCISGYFPAVERGESIIYSIRDQKGRPHVSIEWLPATRSDAWEDVTFELELDGDSDSPQAVFDDPNKFLRSPFVRHGRFEQALGKQNDIPKVEYRRRVHDFIDTYFDDPLGKMLVPIPGELIDARNIELDYKDLSNETSIDDVDFSGSRFTHCILGDFNRAVFKGASFDTCEFHGVVHGCNFDGAKIHGGRFYEGAVTKSTFGKTFFEKVGVYGRSFNGCDLSFAEWVSCELNGVEFFESSLLGAVFAGGGWVGVTLTKSVVSSLDLKPDVRIKNLWLNTVDFTQTPLPTVRRFISALGESKVRADEFGWRDDIFRVTWPEGMAGAAE